MSETHEIIIIKDDCVELGSIKDGEVRVSMAAKRQKGGREWVYTPKGMRITFAEQE